MMAIYICYNDLFCHRVITWSGLMCSSSLYRLACLDLTVVLSSIVTLILPLLVGSESFNANVFRLLRVFRTFRALRSLRVLRTIKFLRSLQVILQTMLRSLPAISNIVFLALIVYCTLDGSPLHTQ